MLQDLRDNSKGVISYILIGFLVLVMAIFGMESLFNWNPAADKAADVNGDRITLSEVEAGVQRKRQELIERFGSDLPASVISSEALGKSVLDELVAKKVLIQTAKSGGMTASDQMILVEAAQSPIFKGANGAFDNQLFVQRLAQAGYTPNSYIQAEKDNTVLRQLYSSVTASSFALNTEVAELVGLINQERSFSYFILPAAKVENEVSVTNDEVADFYSKNEARFTKAEQVAVDYVELNVDALMTNVAVTDEQARRQFELDQANAKATEERRVAHILIENDAAKVASVSEKLASGADFAQLAKEYSDDFGSRDMGGDLGYTAGADLPKAFVDAMQSLEVGTVSGAVVTDLGTHFIRVSDIKSSQVSFDDARLGIIESLKRAEAEAVYAEKFSQLRDLSYNADDLKQVAQELNLPAGNTGLFTEQGGSGVAANRLVIEAAFSEDVMVAGNASEPIELSATHVIVVKKTADQPSHLLPLAEVSDVIKAELTAQKLRQMIEENGRLLIGEARVAENFAEVASKVGAEVVAVNDVKRSSASDVPAEILSFAFSMARPLAQASVIDGVVTGSGDFAVVQLSQVKATAEDLEPAAKAMMAGQISQGVGENDFGRLQAYLVDTAEIETRD